MSRLIDLPHGYQTVVDEADWPAVSALTLYRGNNGYVYYSTWANGKSTPRTLHAFLVHAPKGMHVDHRDGDPLNNRRANLRVATPSINGLNRKGPNKNSRSGVRGVHRALDGKWIAQITVERKHRYIGVYATLEEATAARRAVEAEVLA